MPHRQRLAPDDYLRKYPGERVHVHMKGWLTVSKTGKSVLWDDYKPPTKREIDRENRWRAKRNAYWKTPEGRAEWARHEQMIDDLFARNGTSRAKVAKIISDVIAKAPPLTYVP